MAKLEGMAAGADRGPLKPRLPERLATPEQRIDLAVPLVLESLPELLAELSAGSGLGDGELLLIGRRHQRDNNSWLHNSPRLTRGPARGTRCSPTPTTSPPGASATVTRSSCGRRWGRCASRWPRPTTSCPGVVSLPHGYGHRRAGVRLRHAQELPGVTVNDLTDASVVEGLSGNAVLNGVPVTVAAVPADGGPA